MMASIFAHLKIISFTITKTAIMKRSILLLLLPVVLFACSPSKKSTSNTSRSFAASAPKSSDDGLSYATAIVITETAEGKGVNAEYEWIKKHYDNYKIKMQALSMHDNKPYDVITITQSNGVDLTLYFDISNYFGKF